METKADFIHDAIVHHRAGRPKVPLRVAVPVDDDLLERPSSGWSGTGRSASNRPSDNPVPQRVDSTVGATFAVNPDSVPVAGGLPIQGRIRITSVLPSPSRSRYEPTTSPLQSSVAV